MDYPQPNKYPRDSPPPCSHPGQNQRIKIYLERQEKDIKAFKRDEALLIPSGIDYWGIPGLSSEMRELLNKSQPRTLGGAGRVRGVTPGGLITLLAYVRGQSVLTS